MPRSALPVKLQGVDTAPVRELGRGSCMAIRYLYDGEHLLGGEGDLTHGTL